MSTETTTQVLLCDRCDNGFVDRGTPDERECPVCDGDPKITLDTVAEYARQIDYYRKDRDFQAKALQAALRKLEERRG